MGRKVKKCSKKCTKHLFILKPINHQSIISIETKCRFCISNKKIRSAAPFFNKDRKYFTSSFILPDNSESNFIKQEKHQKNDQNYRMEYFKSKIENHQQKSEIFRPKPSKKHSFCGVCKYLFEDYQEHILSNEHTKQIRKSSINQEIIHLCRIFGNSHLNYENNLQQKTTTQLSKKNQNSKGIEGLNPHQRFKNLIKNINLEQQGWKNAINNSFDVQKSEQRDESNGVNDNLRSSPIKNNKFFGISGNFRLCMGINSQQKE